MTSDKDREKVEKGAVKETVRDEVRCISVTEDITKGTLADKLLAAIDALQPEPVCQDAVSREAVRVMLFEAGGRVYGPKTPYDVLHQRLKKLLPVLPASSERSESVTKMRSEEEIRKAIEYFNCSDAQKIPGQTRVRYTAGDVAEIIGVCFDRNKPTTAPMERIFLPDEFGAKQAFAPDPADKEVREKGGTGGKG